MNSTELTKRGRRSGAEKARWRKQEKGDCRSSEPIIQPRRGSQENSDIESDDTFSESDRKQYGVSVHSLQEIKASTRWAERTVKEVRNLRECANARMERDEPSSSGLLSALLRRGDDGRLNGTVIALGRSRRRLSRGNVGDAGGGVARNGRRSSGVAAWTLAGGRRRWGLALAVGLGACALGGGRSRRPLAHAVRLGARTLLTTE